MGERASISFSDGPASGQKLQLHRDPLFLRVVRDKAGKIDALDQVDDEPAPDEEIFVYRKVSYDGGAFVDGRDPKTGKRFGYQMQMMTYALNERQPDDATARDLAKWQAWCKQEFELRKAEAVETDH